MSQNQYLWNRNGYYYFRMAVPTELLKFYGCRELVYSLRTKNKHDARYRCLKLQQVVHYIFMLLEPFKFEQFPKLKPEEIRKITKDYFNEALQRLETKISKSHRFTSPKAHESENYFYRYNHIRKMGQLTPRYNIAYEDVLKYVIQEYDIKVEEGTLSYMHLSAHIERAVKELRNQNKQRVDGEINIKFKDELFIEEADIIDSVNQSYIPSEQEYLNIADVYKIYIEEQTQSGIKSKTIQSKQRAFELWCELAGDIRINDIKKKHAVEFKLAVAKLPSNKDKRYPGKNVKELIGMKFNKQDMISVTTQNKYLSDMRSFFTWAENHAHYEGETNPFSNISIKDNTKKKDKRDSFSESQLISIFESPIFKGCAGKKQTERYKEGKEIIKDALYWLPLIALYTGARMGEIAQLYVSDIENMNDIYVFHFREDGEDQSIKTSVNRVVPIHSKLIECGLIKYANTQKNKRLFPDVKPTKDGDYSKGFSKKFSRFLKKCKAKTDKTSFHSFRHTIKDRMQNHTSIPVNIRKAIMGHNSGEGVHGDYGSDSQLPVEKLHKEIQKLDYPFLYIK